MKEEQSIAGLHALFDRYNYSAYSEVSIVVPDKLYPNHP